VASPDGVDVDATGEGELQGQSASVDGEIAVSPYDPPAPEPPRAVEGPGGDELPEPPGTVPEPPVGELPVGPGLI
jgi:hypothetical protein